MGSFTESWDVEVESAGLGLPGLQRLAEIEEFLFWLNKETVVPFSIIAFAFV
jgi:hypothetical protein